MLGNEIKIFESDSTPIHDFIWSIWIQERGSMKRFLRKNLEISRSDNQLTLFRSQLTVIDSLRYLTWSYYGNTAAQFNKLTLGR